MELIQNIKKYIWLVAILLVLIIAISVFLYINNGRNVSKEVEVAGVSSVTNYLAKPLEKCDLFVDVSGAVERPNVYCFPKGALVVDAIKKAGGFKNGKYALEYVRSNLNLSKELVSNEKIYIPYSNEVVCSKLVVKLVEESKNTTLVSSDEGNCVSLNEGTKEQLMTLDGVGESLASKIFEKRPFKNIEDLNLVSGVGDQMFEKLRSKICL